jgi:predicted DCC family thiol-disulfide oxidoreductase YuxK
MSEPWIVLFDGTCNLCNGSVRFIMEHDKRGRFAFASAQSPEGQKLAARHGFAGPTPAEASPTPGSMVLLIGDRAYVRSTASLQIARRLDGLWPALFALIIIPAALRDAGYRMIAKRRHRWFGTTDQCVNIPASRRVEEK